MRQHSLIRVSLALAIVVAATACGDRRIGAGPERIGPAMPIPCSAEPLRERTAGAAPFAYLGAGVRPQAAAFHGRTLFMTVFTPCAQWYELALWELDSTTGGATETYLGVTPAGLWHALAITADGTPWVGTRDLLVHRRADGSVERLVVPPAHDPVAADFVSRAGSSDASGAITALAAVGDALVLGRAGHREVTMFDTITRTFAHVPLREPFGEVKSLFALGTSRVAFGATRSIGDPLASRDAVGVLDVRTLELAYLPLLSGALDTRGGQLAYASWVLGPSGIRSELGVVQPDGAPRWKVDADDYDASAFAARGDGAVAVRLSGVRAEIAFLDARGRETRRVPFAAVVHPPGVSVPALAFALFGPGDALWFAVRGRPEIYRIP